MIFDEAIVDGPISNPSQNTEETQIEHESRPILNSLGEEIGTLTLDKSTSESTWQLLLAPYAIPPTPTWGNIRKQRDALISNTIWMMQRHASQLQLNSETTLSSEKYLEWLQYWQLLCDIPTDFSTPEDVSWPIKPL